MEFRYIRNQDHGMQQGPRTPRSRRRQYRDRCEYRRVTHLGSTCTNACMRSIWRGSSVGSVGRVVCLFPTYANANIQEMRKRREKHFFSPSKTQFLVGSATLDMHERFCPSSLPVRRRLENDASPELFWLYLRIRSFERTKRLFTLAPGAWFPAPASCQQRAANDDMQPAPFCRPVTVLACN